MVVTHFNNLDLNIYHRFQLKANRRSLKLTKHTRSTTAALYKVLDDLAWLSIE